MFTVCLSIAAMWVALAGMVATAGSALALMSAAVFFLYLTGSSYWAILQDTVQPENIGGVGGFIHMIANCSGIIGPMVTGFIVETTGSSPAPSFWQGPWPSLASSASWSSFDR